MKPDKPWFWPDTQGFLAIGILTLMAAIIFILLFHQMKLDETINGVLMTIIGVLAGELKNVYGYYFSSTAASKAKDVTINKLAETVPSAEKENLNAAVH